MPALLVHAEGHLFTGGGDGLVKRWRLDKGRYEVCNEFRPASPTTPQAVGRDEDVEAPFPTSPTANIGSNGLIRKPQVRKRHKQHEMLSGFESQRASGCTGVCTCCYTRRTTTMLSSVRALPRC